MGIALGVLCVTPLVLVYLFFIRWIDRFEPEPWWLILAAFVWGACFATVSGGITSSLAGAYTSVWVDTGGTDMDAISATIYAPFFEETFKAIGVGLIALASVYGLRELDGPLDGAIYGGVVGLGFTLTEDILYVAHQYDVGGLSGFLLLVFLRTILLGLSHCTFTACTGIGIGIATVARSRSVKVGAPILGFGAAIAMHAVHNALPTFLGGAGLLAMLLVTWLIDLLFFFLLAMLVVRDRMIVLRELHGEVGSLLHPDELTSVSSYFRLALKNWLVLGSHGMRTFRARRKKQLLLVELAFVKSRRRRGESGADLDRKEAALRSAIHGANRLGVWIG